MSNGQDTPGPGESRFPDVLSQGPLDPGLIRIAPPPRPKFQHRYAKHIILLVVTFCTTTAAWNVGNAAPLLDGLWYSIPVLLILGAHEFGHYALCRVHNVDATLPFFIPLPLPPTGTLGAVIRIREAFPSKRALFDIGVAGPIAGFVVLVPFLYYGLSTCRVEVIPQDVMFTTFGDPLLLQFLERLRFGVLPPGSDIIMQPTLFAAWWGMFATALNLLPFGQLDGGHITYAILGRRATHVSIATLATTILLTVHSLSWIMTALIMLAMVYFLGFHHPRVIDEHEPLDPVRKLVALCALVIFILCFTPVPIDVFSGR